MGPSVSSESVLSFRARLLGRSVLPDMTVWLGDGYLLVVLKFAKYGDADFSRALEIDNWIPR